jgi:1,4-alpha-glucan branching enzyme
VSRRGAARARARARAAERAREAGAVHNDVGAARPREEAVMSDQTGTLEQVDAARAAGSPLSDADLFLFNEGTHLAIYDRLGAQVSGDPARPGVHFAVWAPNAARVSVIGEFNQWDAMAHPLHRRGASGVWAGFVPEARRGELYKYRIQSLFSAEVLEKADPVGLRQELPPATASQVWSLDGHRWRDAAWMAGRAAGQAKDQPISVYEVHLGSWMRIAEEGGRWLTYRELAPRLAAYVKEMGFTHVELMPLAEHPFYGSWGYQGTGYFAATARYGAPEELMFLIDELHCAGIGVILDWVPAHFPNDAHGLARFDGTHLYEHEDPRRGVHPDWNTLIFNYERLEVRSFLLSSAMIWIDKFHVDGLRVDAVASMLYLDYSRREGQWVPNHAGGRENLGAMELLQRLNSAVAERFPGVHVIAEESTAWPLVSRPVADGGLGFSMKWDMGWMHDTLRYLARDPLFRKHHHQEINFRMMYAYAEDFMLPLSHDEVVHGKGSLLRKMCGDRWQQLAHLRLLYAYMMGMPGKKLLFMGGELAQEREWDHEGSLDWALLERPEHRGIQAWVAALNHLYTRSPALYQLDFDPRGFCWVDADDAAHSVASFVRLAAAGAPILVVLNFTPVPRPGYVIGAPCAGAWEVALSSDQGIFGGTGAVDAGAVMTAQTGPLKGMPAQIVVDLPPLAAIFLRGPEAGWEGCVSTG